MNVGVVRDEIYLEHRTDAFHPENAGRLFAIYSMLARTDQSGIVWVPARAATDEEIALNHAPAYVDMVRETRGRAPKQLDPDTVTSARSYDAACFAAGGFLALIDAAISGPVDNGFAFVRPPGHHAESDKAMGFCIFNNCAIGARYLQKRHGFDRIMIVDYDVHHGNGTQHSFYRDPGVLYVSAHQYPHYPGSGWYDEIGIDEGAGYTVNIPMAYGMGDAEYAHVFRHIVVPLGLRFRPRIVLVSAGFDIHRDDPLGGMRVTGQGFARITRLLVEMAEKVCEGRLICVLEGGYDTRALADSAEAVLNELRGKSTTPGDGEEKHPTHVAEEIVSRVKQAIAPYWKGL
jgi:acetoin utilization deacetylase AcuC-like enzyme